MTLVQKSGWLMMLGLVALNGCNESRTESRELPATTKTAAVASGVSRSSPERMVLQLIDEDDLSTSQRDQLAAIRVGIGADWRALSQKSTSAARAFRTDLTQGAPDAPRTDARTNEVLALHATLAHHVADEVLSLVATFTPAQRAHLAEHVRYTPDRAAMAASLLPAFSTPMSAKETDGSWQPNASPGAADVVGRPEMLGLAIAQPTHPSTSTGLHAHKLRRELRKGLSDVDALIDSVTPALASELAKPEPNAHVVHAFVDEALTKYHATIHASVRRALSLRPASSGGAVTNSFSR